MLAAATPNAAEQAAVISGVVADQTGASVAAAQVELVSGAAVVRSAVTAADGRSRLDGLQAGDYTLRVTVPGLQATERRVAVTASGTAVADIRLAVQTVEERVVVSGEQVRAEVEAQRAATSGGVTVVDTEDLYRRQVNGLADLLRYVPGVWAESSFGA